MMESPHRGGIPIAQKVYFHSALLPEIPVSSTSSQNRLLLPMQRSGTISSIRRTVCLEWDAETNRPRNVKPFLEAAPMNESTRLSHETELDQIKKYSCRTGVRKVAVELPQHHRHREDTPSDAVVPHDEALYTGTGHGNGCRGRNPDLFGRCSLENNSPGDNTMSVSVMVRAERGCRFRTWILPFGRGWKSTATDSAFNPVCESCNRPLLVPIRGIQRMEPNIIWGICPEWNDTSYPCHQMNCPTCNPPEKAYVVWVGESFYETPESYLDEVRRMGISRKIPFVPEDLNVGDWVFLGFRKLIPTGEYNREHEEIKLPGIFHAFRVTSIEKLLTDAQQKDQHT